MEGWGAGTSDLMQLEPPQAKKKKPQKLITAPVKTHWLYIVITQQRRYKEFFRYSKSILRRVKTQRGMRAVCPFDSRESHTATWGIDVENSLTLTAASSSEDCCKRKAKLVDHKWPQADQLCVALDSLAAGAARTTKRV